MNQQIKEVLKGYDYDTIALWLTSRTYSDVAFEVKRRHGFFPDRYAVQWAAREMVFARRHQ